MQMKTLLAAIAAAIFATTPAMATTVTNKSGTEITIGVDMGNKESVHKVPAGQSVTFKSECENGCGLTGPWAFSWMLKSGEKLETDGKPLVTVAK